MNKELCDITVVLDRSGSMSACQKEAEDGLNLFVDKQKKLPGKAVFTLIQFDDRYEFVHKAIDIKKVPQLSIMPRGNTALLDAIGQAITETGERLKAMHENDRPGLVVFVILTDGEENASHEFSKAAIKEMIDRQQNVYKWQFLFLGANQDAFAEAGELGIAKAGAANYAPQYTSRALGVASDNVGRMRSASAKSMPITNDYTEEERETMK